MGQKNSTFDEFIIESGLETELKNIQISLKNKIISKTQANKLIKNLIDSKPISSDLTNRIIEEFDQQQEDFYYQNDKGRTLIIGNGDVQNILDIEKKAEEFEIDGAMIGRAIFHNPWAFDPNVSRDVEGNLYNISTGELITISQRINLLKYHLKLWQETWGENKHYPVLKKYFKIYISGFAGAAALRQKLMDTNSLQDAQEILSGLSF
jgi:hypothetical protein